MAFRIKDLMITLIPRGSQLPGGGIGGHCGEQGCTGCSNGCSASCEDGASDDPERSRFLEVSNPANLVLLKQRLKVRLAEVEARERSVNESLRPKSLEDIDFLEQQLKSALEELNAMRQEIARQGNADG